MNKMAGSMRAELASSSLDGSSFAVSYSSGQRGSYSSSSLDRSVSFRESLENRVMFSGPSTSRNASPSLEILPVSQYLMLEPVSMSEQKYTRSGELRRVLGISLEEHSFGSVQNKLLPPIALEELKRFKASMLESSNKARDRAKLFLESMTKLDKYRNLLSRKRQRNDIPPSEKSGGSNLLKMGGQMHQSSSNIVGQKLEDRAKNVVPSKRVRSSMAEVRSEGRVSIPMRQGNFVDKEKNVHMEKDKAMLRTCNGVTTPIEDKIHGLPAGGDGWEKKMKRKHSAGTMVTRIQEGDRELKTAIQQRPNNECHSRTSDTLGFRSGSSSGVNGSNNTQLTAASSRMMPKNELDVASLVNERRDRSSTVDKERSIAKGSTKVNMREDTQVGGQNALTKSKASRQPRTGSGAMINSSCNFPRSLGGNDGWEQPAGVNKIQSLPGTTNRKRLLPMGSSSPPVTQWVGQRPQKISRTRRQNVVSPVSNFDESQSLSEGYLVPDAGPKLLSMEPTGLLLPKGMSSSSQQLKLKPENIPSPAGFSESEESGAMENKPKEKEVDNGEAEDGVLNPVHRVATFVLPTKKNKVPLKDELGDGVRRQGRSGRSSLQPKANLPFTKEKLENIDTNKPVRIGRPGLDKSESRVGRPPSKKGSDRKAYTRPGQIINIGSSELTGESDDDREELRVIASAARNANYAACSSSFWKKMDPFFTFINSEDINHLKLQISLAEALDESLHSMLDDEHNTLKQVMLLSMGHDLFSSFMVSSHSSGLGVLGRRAAPSPNSLHSMEKKGSQVILVRPKKSSDDLCLVYEAQPIERVSGKLETERWFEKMVPLSQRLLSAFIAENGTEKVDGSADKVETFLHFSSDDSPFCTSSLIEDEYRETDLVKHESKLEVDFNHQKNFSRESLLCNRYDASSNFSSPNIQNIIYNDEMLQENVLVCANSGSFSEFGQANSDQLQTANSGFHGTSPTDCQYEHMSLDERILMELHSIGLYPEAVPDLVEGEDEEIEKDILELKIRLYEQVRKKKGQFHKLEIAIQDVKDIEERNLEQLAMNKLVEVAYKKLVGGRGSHSHKSGASKILKQLAAAFAKRTLVRCQKFEETGRSCFSESPLRDVIFCSPPQTCDAKYLDGNSSGTNVELHSGPAGSRVTASGVTSNMIDGNGNNHKFERGLSDPLQSLAQMSDQASVKPGKKKEVLLDDVVTIAASRATSNLSHALPGAAKGKRTERDRDLNKETSARSSIAKAGRPSLSNGRGERKTKTKPKQKIAQLSSSGNGLLGRATENTNTVLPSRQESCGTVNNGSTKINQEAVNSSQDFSKEVDDNIFTNLPLQAIDSIEELDVADGLGGQGQDIGSWLNVDEDMLQDHDLVGLEIPMDDLSELKLNF